MLDGGLWVWGLGIPWSAGLKGCPWAAAGPTVVRVVGGEVGGDGAADRVVEDPDRWCWRRG